MEIRIFTYFLGLVFFAAAQETLKYECPEPEDIFPCYCEEEDGDPMVFCNHFHDPEQLYKGVKGFDGYKVYKMSFFMNWILDPIKSDAFKGLAIQQLSFENSTVTLRAPQFQGLESHLNIIQLRAIFNISNPIYSLDLGHLKNLREVVFEKNRITTLPNNWLISAPESLRSITVEENTLITLEDEVFAKIKRLTFMVLESNRIVIIKRSMFPRPANDLRSLNLNNNRIRYLPDDLFSEMPYLRNLEMAGNRITTLDERVWSVILFQLTKLDLLDNPLVCDSNLKWIYSNSSGKLPVMLDGHCKEPEKLKEKSLVHLNLEDLS